MLRLVVILLITSPCLMGAGIKEDCAAYAQSLLNLRADPLVVRYEGTNSFVNEDGQSFSGTVSFLYGHDGEGNYRYRYDGTYGDNQPVGGMDTGVWEDHCYYSFLHGERPSLEVWSTSNSAHGKPYEEFVIQDGPLFLPLMFLSERDVDHYGRGLSILKDHMDTLIESRLEDSSIVDYHGRDYIQTELHPDPKGTTDTDWYDHCLTGISKEGHIDKVILRYDQGPDSVMRIDSFRMIQGTAIPERVIYNGDGESYAFSLVEVSRDPSVVAGHIALDPLVYHHIWDIDLEMEIDPLRLSGE